MEQIEKNQLIIFLDLSHQKSNTLVLHGSTFNTVYIIM